MELKTGVDSQVLKIADSDFKVKFFDLIFLGATEGELRSNNSNFSRLFSIYRVSRSLDFFDSEVSFYTRPLMISPRELRPNICHFFKLIYKFSKSTN